MCNYNRCWKFNPRPILLKKLWLNNSFARNNAPKPDFDEIRGFSSSVFGFAALYILLLWPIMYLLKWNNVSQKKKKSNTYIPSCEKNCHAVDCGATMLLVAKQNRRRAVIMLKQSENFRTVHYSGEAAACALAWVLLHVWSLGCLLYGTPFIFLCIFV
jgi:hypothetical protein